MLVMVSVDNHSRVVLDVADGGLESDYINASYIDVCSTFAECFVDLC